MPTTVADYAGRTIDLLMWDGMEEAGEQLLNPTLALPGEGGKVITGIQKLAQRFILELLTEKGSLLYLPDRGTEFMLLMRTGRLRTTLDVEQAFASALLDIQENFRTEEDGTEPDDELLDTAELEAVTILADRLVLHVRLTSQAGTDRQIILPLSTALRRT